jgi:two-component system LytT family response regulator
VTATVLVVEDEPLARGELRRIVDGLAWLRCVGEAEDGPAAVRLMDELRPDLVLLDVELPGFSGVEALSRARHDPAVVFTTAYDRFAVVAFELGALDYVLKPFRRERLVAALERARQVLETRGVAPPAGERVRETLRAPGATLTRLFVRDRGAIIPVPAAGVVHIEAEGDFAAIHAGDRRYLVHVSLAELERRLDPARFFRIHRSHIVNLEHVAAIVPFDGQRFEVAMSNGVRIMASRSRSKELREMAL